MRPDRIDRMFITTPNTGSTWLVQLLAKWSNVAYYDKEFFNPGTSPIYRKQVSDLCGSEMIGTYKNIARPVTEEEIKTLLENTWWQCGWNLDKEVYSMFRIPQLSRFFEIAIIERRTDEVFPPSRQFVWAWYEAIYWSCVENNVPVNQSLDGLAARAMEAYRVCWNVINSTAANKPRIQYDYLMLHEEQDIRAYLDTNLGAFLPSLDVKGAARDIVATRKTGHKTWRGLTV